MNEEARKKLTTRRWIILVISCFINLCIGSLYAWSVFAGPMAEYLAGVLGMQVTVAQLAVVFTVANSVGPITLISGGYINDKLGPKWVVFAGGLLFGTGMLLSGFAANRSMLIIGYGLGCGLAMGLVYGCTVSNAVKFFPDKRGLIGGITTASYGISSVIIPPIANILIEKTGVLNTFRILGIVFILTICIGAFFMEQCPDDFIPIGYEIKVENLSRKEYITKDQNWKKMIKDPVFWVMILMLTCGAVFGLMTISQVSPIAQNMVGMTVASATTAVSILALFNAAGRVAAGYLSDIVGRINILLIMLFLAIGGLLLLYFTNTGEHIKFYLGISVVGLCFGAFMGVFPGFTADQFGPRNNSMNYGIMFIGFAMAGYLGPMIMSKLYLKTNSYQPAFLAAIGLAIAGIILNLIYRKLVKSQEVLKSED